MRFENIFHMYAVQTHNGFKTELTLISYIRFIDSILLQIQMCTPFTKKSLNNNNDTCSVGKIAII